MPLYEYQCDQCGRFEVIRKFSDAPLTACPTCGKPIEKLLSSPAIQFKGSGWYITDYARKSGGSGKDGKADAKSDGGKSDGGKSDSSKDSGGSSTTSSTPAATSTTSGGGSKGDKS